MARVIEAAMMAAFVAGVALFGSPALAADNAMKTCGAKYQAAKSAKTLPTGQTWPQFLAQCRSGMATPAAAVKPAPRPMVAAPTKPAPAARSAVQPSAAMAAMHDRQRRCGQQWTTAKAAGKVAAGETWPHYWSQCNARLKS